MKLNIKAFAIVVGLFWGLGIFPCTWWIIFLVLVMASNYPKVKRYEIA